MATVAEIVGLLRLTGGAEFEREITKRLTNAKKSFLNIQNAIVGGGVALIFKNINEAANRAETAALALKAIGQFKGIQGANEAIDQLDAVRLGFVQSFEAADALKNLLLHGYDLDQAISSLDRLYKAAALNRNGQFTLAEAVRTATEGFKIGSSILINNAGITKNLNEIYQDYAKTLGKNSQQLTAQEKVQAEVNGIIEETLPMMNDLAKLSDTAAGAQARFTSQFTKVRALFGQILQQFGAPVIEFFGKFLKFLIDAPPAVRNFVAAGAGVIIFFKLLGGAIQALLPAMGPVGWIITGLTVLTGLFFAFEASAKESADEINNFREELMNLTAEQAEAKLAQLKETLAALQTEIGMQRWGAGFLADTGQQEKEVARIKAQITEIEGALGGLRKKKVEGDADVAKQRMELQDKIKEFEFETGKITTQQYLAFLMQRLAGLKQYEDDWFTIAKRIYDIEKDLRDKDVKAAKRIYDIEKDLRDKDVKAAEEWRSMRKRVLDRAGTDAENLWDRMLQAQDDFEEAQDERNRTLQEKWTSISEFISASAENLFGGIFGAVQRGQNVLKAALKSILITTLEFIKQFVVLTRIKALLEGIINPLTILKNLAPLVIAAGLLTAAQGAIASFGDGGIVRKPTLAMVGERGEAEAVVPLSKIGDFVNAVQGNNPRTPFGKGDHMILNFNSPLQDRRLARQMMEKVIKPGVRREMKRSGRVTNRKIF